MNPFGTSKTTKAAAGTLAGLLLACAGSAFVQANDTEPSSVPATSQSSSLSNLLRSSSSSTPSEPSAPPEEVLDCVSPFGRAHFQLDLNGPVGPNQQASTHRLTGNILPLPDGDLAVCMLQGAFLSVIKLHWPTHRPSSFLAFPGEAPTRPPKIQCAPGTTGLTHVCAISPSTLLAVTNLGHMLRIDRETAAAGGVQDHERGWGTETFAAFGGLGTSGAPDCMIALPDGAILAGRNDSGAVHVYPRGGTATLFAGTGTRGHGIGSTALETEIMDVSALLREPDGCTLIGDAANGRVLRVAMGGAVTLLIDQARVREALAGMPSRLKEPFAPGYLARLGTGSILVADDNNSQVLQVDPDGRITVFAGCGPGEQMLGAWMYPSTRTQDPTAMPLGRVQSMVVLPDDTVVLSFHGTGRLLTVYPADELQRDLEVLVERGLAAGAAGSWDEVARVYQHFLQIQRPRLPWGTGLDCLPKALIDVVGGYLVPTHFERARICQAQIWLKRRLVAIGADGAVHVPPPPPVPGASPSSSTGSSDPEGKAELPPARGDRKRAAEHEADACESVEKRAR